MAAHTGAPGAEARETALPAVRRRRRRTDWGRVLARVLCAVLALVGMVPFVTTVVLRSTWARTWAAHQTERLLREQGVVASYTLALHVWPLAVELDDVRVESSDGGAPALTCTRASVRPRIFALLAGKLAIDQVELDEPHVRAVVKDGQIANLALKRSSTAPSSAPKWPTRAPFNGFALTDAALDLDIEGTQVVAKSLDLDVVTDQGETELPAFEVSVRAGQATVHHTHALPSGGVATDDDALCSIEGRARIESTDLLVRRLEGVGSADLEPAAGTTPSCDLPADDKRRVELSLGHLHVGFPGPDVKIPPIDGHVRVRAPIGIAERLASIPETDGWIGLDADVRYAQDSILPDVSGNLEAHNVRLLQYSFASELHSQFAVRNNVVTSPTTTLRLGNGLVTLTDTVVDPLAKGARVEKTRVDVAGEDFTALLRDLGVHRSSWVGWDIREVHTTTVSGTIVPLKLDGELTAKTYTFGVYDRPAEDKARERIFGVAEAQIATHLAIRPDALRFENVHVTMPHSQIDGGLVSIGFHNDLIVEVPHMVADLEDVSPIGPVVLKGKVEAAAKVEGKFNKPLPEGDIKSVSGLVVSDVSFGDISGGHVKVDVEAPQVDFTDVHGKKGDSPYDVPTATLRFGKGFAVDAFGQSPGFGLRDLLSMFALDQDPRYDGLDARIATRANVHVALGGPEDVCGSGYIAVDAKSELSAVGIYGEHFAKGDADVSMRWYDRQQGIAGADVDVRSFVLDKIQPPTGTRAGATGTVLGSASVRRGGDVTANVMIENVPLSRVDALGTLGSDVEGAVSGVAHVTGNLDDARPDAQLVARAELDVGGMRLREISFPPSHLDVGMTQRFPQQTRSMGRTKCGASIAPPFDKAAYQADTSSHGQWTLSGSLLGGTVSLTDVVVTRARSSHLTGRVSVRGLDLGALARVRAAGKEQSDDTVVRASSSDIGGQFWGEIIADDVPLDDPARAKVRIFLGPTVVSRGGQKLTLQPPSVPLLVADDALSMPPLEVTLQTPEGFQGGFVVTGNVTKLVTDPTLALDARLQPVDLAVLQRLVPKIERASGKLEGNLHLTGHASSPTIAGDLHATAEDIEVQGLPSAVTDVKVDVHASATELSAAGAAKFAGGTVALNATMPVRGTELGALDSRITARGVRLTPADGVAATFDADLVVAYDPNGHGNEGGANLPRISGDVTIDSFAYTRPISLATDLTSLGARAKRTQVTAYDPALDLVSFDVRVRSRAPLVVKNNLVEVQLSIDSGALEVTGTNQRLGLRGELQTLPGGRFHFQSSEFDVRQGLIRFEDPTRIAPNVDVTAVTEYRRYTDTSASAAAGAGTGAGTGPAAASVGSTRGGSLWRITLHAYGDADNLRVDLTSEPSLSQEDIVLLLAVGMTRAELDQLQASSIGASIALNYLGAASGASNAVKQALPVIDDFRFGSAYSTVTGKTEPQLTIGKRLTNDVRASVTAGLSEDRELRSNIEWRLNNRFSVQGSYDNINDVSSSTLGNLGVDLRWRLEFE